MRPLLTYNGYASGGAKAYSLGPNSFVQIGDNIGTNDSGTATTIRLFPMGKIVQIKNTIYVLHQRTIKKKNSDGTWSTVASLVSPNTTSGVDHMNQMIPCVIGGVQYLACLYLSSDNGGNTAYRLGVYNTVTETLSTSNAYTDMNRTLTSATYGYPFYYDGNIYWPAFYPSFGTRMIIANIEALSVTMTNDGLDFGDNPTNSFTVFNNELYMLFHPDGTGKLLLYKLVGSGWTHVVDVTASTAWQGNGPKTCLFTDGTNMYAMALLSTNTQWKMYKITPSFTVTDITNTVIPGFTGQGNTSSFRFICDQHSNPTSPEFYLMLNTGIASGSTNRFYRFFDDSTPVQYIGTAGEGGTANYVSCPTFGGGELMFRDGEMHIEFWGAPEISNTPGNMKLYFRIYESDIFPSGSPVHVKFFSSNGRSIPTQPCRLSNPEPIGSIENSYTITDITCGSGILYSVDWRAVADGFTAGDPVTMVASVSGVI